VLGNSTVTTRDPVTSRNRGSALDEQKKAAANLKAKFQAKLVLVDEYDSDSDIPFLNE
jgi:hypothetical protein